MLRLKMTDQLETDAPEVIIIIPSGKNKHRKWKSTMELMHLIQNQMHNNDLSEVILDDFEIIVKGFIFDGEDDPG